MLRRIEMIIDVATIQGALSTMCASRAERIIRMQKRRCLLNVLSQAVRPSMQMILIGVIVI